MNDDLTMPYTEANYENSVIEIFRDVLGYSYVYGPDVARDYSSTLYMDELPVGGVCGGEKPR